MSGYCLLCPFRNVVQVLEGAADEEVQDIETVLGCLEAEIAASRNFEFCQALLQLTLHVHGDAILKYPSLRSAAGRVNARLKASWAQLDELLQSTRCMVSFLGNLQA